MLEPVHVTGAEDKTTAQLKKISPELMIRMPGGFSASARLGIVASQQVKQVSAFELHGGIGFTLLVNQQGKGNARFLAESACIHAITKPHGGQMGSSVPENLFMGAQLRDVLAAEDSAVMAQENYCRRLPDP